MDSWHATFLGLRHLPREVTAFEVEVFFQFSAEEALGIIEETPPAGAQAWACFADRLFADERQAPRCGSDRPAASVAASRANDSALPPRTWRRCARCTGVHRR